MEATQYSYQTEVNGTVYTVAIASSENAKQTYEELVKRQIQIDAEQLSSENQNDF